MNTRTDQRGFTLLETLLALTTLAALAALIAALLGQMRLWAGAQEPAAQALRPAQIQSLLREQLRERVAAGSTDAGGASAREWARMETDALIFYTSAPALLPDAAIVRVAYTIEREERSRLVGGQVEPRAALALSERRVLDVQRPDAGAQGASASALSVDMERSATLLTDCAALTFEAPVRRERVEPAGAGDAGQAAPAIQWVSFAAHLAQQSEEVNGPAATGEGERGAPASAQAPTVVRLRGECGGKEVLWILAGGASLSY